MEEEQLVTPAKKSKRDIVVFSSDSKPTSINLEYVTHMVVEGNKITFTFISQAIFIEFNTPEAAKSAFDGLNNIWSGHEIES